MLSSWRIEWHPSVPAVFTRWNREKSRFFACIYYVSEKYNLLPFASLGGYKRETLRTSFSIVAWDVQCVTHQTISSPPVMWEHDSLQLIHVCVRHSSCFQKIFGLQLWADHRGRAFTFTSYYGFASVDFWDEQKYIYGAAFLS